MDAKLAQAGAERKLEQDPVRVFTPQGHRVAFPAAEKCSCNCLPTELSNPSVTTVECIILRIMAVEPERQADLSVEEKRAALDFALQSEVLGRSERLKSLLSYICNAEFEGQHDRLTEYDIAVSALGRRKDFSAAEDSAVRSRTYELRQKLERLYAVEAPDYPVQIDLHKGSYRPRFHRTPKYPAEPPQDPPATIPAQGLWWGARAVGITSFLVGVLATLFLVRLISGHQHDGSAAPLKNASDDHRWTPELHELWAPFLSDSRPAFFVFETRLFVTVGPGIVMRDPSIESIQKIESSRPIMDVKRLLRVPEVYEARRYSDFSVVDAVFSITNLLSGTGLPLNVERSVDISNEDIHANNLILVGKPGAFDGVKGMSAPALNFVIDYNHHVRNLHPMPGEKESYIESGDTVDTGGLIEEFALITMIPGPEKGQHILSLVAPNSEEFWPLALYITEPGYAKELVNHLRLPTGKIPDAYEVLISIEERNQRPIRIAYVAHRVIRAVD